MTYNDKLCYFHIQFVYMAWVTTFVYLWKHYKADKDFETYFVFSIMHA